MHAVSRFIRDRWFSLLLIVIALAMYVASLNFGLIWDDPKWYQQGAGQTTWELFTSLDTYQFYRPIAIWLNRQLVAPSGVIAAQAAHFLQIAAHLIATLAVVPVLRALKFDRRVARFSAFVFAIYPLSYQAVAWQAPQQPIATLAVFVSILAADRFLQRDRVRYLLASVAAYAFALLFQESALPFAWVFVWLAISQQSLVKKPRSLWPLIHLALAAIYFIIWLNVPRQIGITGRGLDARVLAYALQSIVFPVAGAGSSGLINWPVATLLLVFAAITLLLLLGLWKWRGWRSAVIALGWVISGVGPALIGLSWSYVRIGSRVMYPAALGVAMLWGSWATLLLDKNRAKWLRSIGGLITVMAVVVAFTQWLNFQQLYQKGTQFLDQTIAVLADHRNQRLLFVNYPDRIELLPAPYPLGNWGLILAPIVQNLSDYAMAKVGYSASAVTLAAFRVGAAQRGAWQYDVFMRGEDTPAEKLAEVAAQADRVYVVDYAPDGQLQLREVGAVRSSPASSSIVASFGEVARLAEAKVTVEQGVMVQLTWHCLKPLKDGDTLFVHLWKDGAFVSAFDGDSLGGLVPPSVWPIGGEVIDVRSIPLQGLAAGHYEVRIGLYNRNDNTRYPASASMGDRIADDAVLIGTIDRH